MARMGDLSRGAMLATLGGTLALLLGLAILVLPLLVSELSRPRDSVWGALVLLLGLVLVTSAERLTGEPMLAVLLGGLLIGRLGGEVAQARWIQLTLEERQHLASAERWRTSFDQLGASIATLLERSTAVVANFGAWIAERRKPPAITKRWVRPESAPPEAANAPEAMAKAPEESTTPAEAPREPDNPAAPTAVEPAAFPDTAAPEAAPTEAAATGEPAGPESEPTPVEGTQGAEEVIVVSGFDEIDALLAATEASPEEPPTEKPGGPEAG
jgi:hypothetical protein